MKTSGILATFALGAAALVSLVAVAGGRTVDQPAVPRPTNTATQERLVGGPPFVDSFDSENERLWFVSHGWRNGDWAVNDWRRSQVRFDDKLRLTLARKKTDKAEFSGGEVQTRRKYGHGYYEVKMRAAPASGTVSGFFTYTGPSFGDPWDEIDVEILGSKPREVMFTYFRDGEKVSHIHQLGYDATAEDHVYGFDWQPGYIRWYVDGELAHEATGEGLPLPIKKQKIMASLWGSQQLTSWVGPFDPATLPAVMTVDCISFSEDFANRQSCG
ncbi:family 16 glycosylhydrolase [Aurantiacibacter suaedae]|uniref:family 16 glycosylhydrolase n=1 Tax=Aurantiacibacter suaedae TaxID=2545755 RepID=UPI0010F593E0|nr:family 16 glycosylhydrolase [Aurantiacibacter suaedae]